MFAAVGDEGRDSHWPVPPYTLATVSPATQPDTCIVDCDCLRLTCTTLQRRGLEGIRTTKVKILGIFE